MLGVHPRQILKLRFQLRSSLAFLVGWGAARAISWSSQCTAVTGVSPVTQGRTPVIYWTPAGAVRKGVYIVVVVPELK